MYMRFTATIRAMRPGRKRSALSVLSPPPRRMKARTKPKSIMDRIALSSGLTNQLATMFATVVQLRAADAGTPKPGAAARANPVMV
jgi:hypothetical protein